jgi:SAM-dependent methyltransferase
MNPKLLDILVCPDTGEPLGLEVQEYDSQQDQVRTGRLVSPSGKVYPILNSIPRFVDTDEYAGNFSMQWHLHKTTQYATESNPFSRLQFQEVSGWRPEDLRGKRILDAGCGSGRFTEILRECGAEVVGVDLSFAIDAAWQVIGDRENVNLVQASIFSLPFRPGCFDYIWSYGVLMATPDTRRAFACVADKIRPGGQIAIWIYSNYSKWASFCSDQLRCITVHLPKRVLYALCWLSVPLYFVYKIPVIGYALRNTFVISMRSRWRWRILETFDWYSPAYQWKHRYPEVSEWFRQEALELVHVSKIPIGMVGRKS